MWNSLEEGEKIMVKRTTDSQMKFSVTKGSSLISTPSHSQTRTDHQDDLPDPLRHQLCVSFIQMSKPYFERYQLEDRKSVV